MMSLRGASKRKLFYHSCDCRFLGTFQHHYEIHQNERHRSLNRYLIPRIPHFLSRYDGARLLSFSLNNCSFLSWLASYFTQKKVNDDKDSKNEGDQQEHDNSQRTMGTEGFSKEQKDHKWVSLTNRLPISSPFNKSRAINTTLKDFPKEEDVEKKRQFRKHILASTETFLKKYNKDLDLILIKASTKKVKTQKVHKETKDKAVILKSKLQVDYPVVKQCKNVCVKMSLFEETKQFLQSLCIPCDQLEHYPNIQQMSKERIQACVNKLKEKGIYVVFALFLIDYASWELNQEQNKDKKKKRRVPLTSYRQVKAYLELCQLLEIPDLNIRKLLEQLAEKEMYFDIFELHRKVKLLREIGATAQDILSNFELLYGFEIFYEKIELYKKFPHSQLIRTFPVHLFLTKNMASFKQQLALGKEIDQVTKLLDVSISDFQECWGFREYDCSKLQYKVKMCLAAGISKKDIFNNLAILMSFPVDQCHAVTSCFRNFRLPASVFVLREMVDAAELNGNGNINQNYNENNNQNCNSTFEEDWHGESKTMLPAVSPPDQQPTHIQTLSLRKTEVSTKKLRKTNFKLIKRLLNLSNTTFAVMLESNACITDVEILDVTKNLEYLLSLNFTKQQISMCPLVLVHPHESLMTVVDTAENLIRAQLQSAYVASQVDSSSAPTDPLSSDSTNTKYYMLVRLLCSSPLHRLNTFQYFLEKEHSFSLDLGKFTDFLNV